VCIRWPENCPPTESGFSQGFYSPFCHLMEFWFLATVTSGLLSWEHFIFNNIIDLTVLTLLNQN